MARICIGIPAYNNVAAETLEDYMRFAYYCGRRLPEHEFLLAIRTKSEQFRARNAIVEAAIQTGCDYLLFLDDDHVIDWETTSGPNSRYGFLTTLMEHMDEKPDLGIVGALYYHRGAQCRPVIMKEGKDGGFYWVRDDQIIHGYQEVAVTGGGCMLMRLSMIDRIKAPWFEPEYDMGTDVQICHKARAAGFKVACDTSLIIGHVLSRREIVTPQNRNRIAIDNAKLVAQGDEGIDNGWKTSSALSLYRMDAEEYTGKSMEELVKLAEGYNFDGIEKCDGDYRQYYIDRGHAQIGRQVWFHHLPAMAQQAELWWTAINTAADGYGLDFGCGSAPVSFEIAMRGHRMDFLDIDGAAGYEFTKWRAKKRGIEDRCGFKLAGPYDYILALDSIEHIPNWEEVLGEILPRLKDKGMILTNFFINTDFNNPEHVNMDHAAVKKFFIKHGIYPINDLMWVKQDMGFMDEQEVAA